MPNRRSSGRSRHGPSSSACPGDPPGGSAGAGHHAPRRGVRGGIRHLMGGAGGHDPTVRRASQARSRYHSAASRAGARVGTLGYVGATWGRVDGAPRADSEHESRQLEDLVGARGVKPPRPTSLSRFDCRSGSRSTGPSGGFGLVDGRRLRDGSAHATAVSLLDLSPPTAFPHPRSQGSASFRVSHERHRGRRRRDRPRGGAALEFGAA